MFAYEQLEVDDQQPNDDSAQYVDVLVCPTRVVTRLADLTPNETAALFTSVQRVGQVIERAYDAHGLTIACQVSSIVYVYTLYMMLIS